MEWTIIGNGVIGVSRDVEDPETGPTFHRRVGTKLYALADHLGSVRAVVGDVKLPASGGTFTADVMSVYDYEAYGVPRPGLSLDVRAYWRYGFQGMLKQSELLGSTTDVSDYLTPFRSYDARSGRWRSHDPIFQPWESTYLGMGGNPAMLVDPWGLKGTGLTYQKSAASPLSAAQYGTRGIPGIGSTPPKMPNVLDGIRKAQGTTPPSSYAMAGSERFVPDWVKKQGKSWTDGFVDAFTAEANEALDGIKNAPEAIQEAVSAFLKDPGGFIGDLVKAGLGDFGELLNLIELRSNPKHPYDAGQRNGKLAFRALGFLGGAGLTGLAARAPRLLKLLKGKAKKVVQDDVTPPSSRYDDVTAPRSRVPNRATNVSRTEFEDNLAKNGWQRGSSRPDGAVDYQKDGARYYIRDGAKSTDSPTADFYPKGSTKPILKIRLDQGGMP